MPSTTISLQSTLHEGDSQSIPFRPEAPGTVFIQSTPPPANAPSETRTHAYVQLFKPNNHTPLKTVRVPDGSQVLSLAYNVSDADLVAPGDWIAAVVNTCRNPYVFSTQVSFPNLRRVHSATVDLAFLNLILAKLFDAAAIRGHIETHPNLELSSVSLKPDVAALFHLPPWKTFNIPDIAKFGAVCRIKRLDTDPDSPTAHFSASPPALNASVRIAPSSAQFESRGTVPLPNIEVRRIDVSISVGLDGSVRPSCDADVHIDLLDWDLSGDVRDRVLDGINKVLRDPQYAATFGPAALRGYIDKFFRLFMRLDDRATDLSYIADGQTLRVEYTLPTA